MQEYSEADEQGIESAENHSNQHRQSSWPGHGGAGGPKVIARQGSRHHPAKEGGCTRQGILDQDGKQGVDAGNGISAEYKHGKVKNL